MRSNKRYLTGLVTILFMLSLFAGFQSAYANGSKPLIETDELANNLGSYKLVYVGFVGDDNKKKYEAKHIPGSAYIHMNDLMATLGGDSPDKAKFEAAMGALGISNDSHVVLYGTPAANPFIPGMYWVMKYFGHDKVSILNGSFDKWNKEGRKSTGEPTNISATKYTATEGNKEILSDAAYIMGNLKNSSVKIVDSRAADEYTGKTKRTYIKRAGHIPGATNLNFYPSNRNGDGTYKSVADIKKTYEAAGVTSDKEVITYCEGGPRAADAYFALKELAGYKKVKVYVGSWMQWGNDEKKPLEK